jgi:hypothetical protein
VIHWYKVVSEWTRYDWGGIICQRKEWKCRFCGQRRVRMRGSMDLS